MRRITLSLMALPFASIAFAPVFITPSQAQQHTLTGNVSVAWTQHYAEPDSLTEFAAMVVDAAGNVYVTGYTFRYRTENRSYDYLTIKYSSHGEIQWVAGYAGPGKSEDKAKAIAVDQVGNVYVTGSCNDFGSTASDFLTIKYNSRGEQKWIARYDGPAHHVDQPRAMTMDDAGNVIITGRANRGPALGVDIVTIKYDSTGKEQWAVLYGKPRDGTHDVQAIFVDNSQNVYLAGSDSKTVDAGDFVTIKYDLRGIEQWVARYEGPAKKIDYAMKLQCDNAGNLYVAGTSNGNGTFKDFALIKYDTMTGSRLWVRRYDGPANLDDQVYALALDAEGNVFVGGTSDNLGTATDYAIIKYTPAGQRQWVARYDGPGNWSDYPIALSTDEAGNVYSTGWSFGANTSQDIATVKYSAEGAQQWVARYSWDGTDYSKEWARVLCLDRDGNVYVAGFTEYYHPTHGWILSALIKYEQSATSVDDRSNTPSPSYALNQNYPNPFNATTIIRYSLAQAGKVKVRIFNLAGQEIETLVNENQAAGEHELHWHPTGLASGIYLYRLESERFVATRKLILLE